MYVCVCVSGKISVVTLLVNTSPVTVSVVGLLKDIFIVLSSVLLFATPLSRLQVPPSGPLVHSLMHTLVLP